MEKGGEDVNAKHNTMQEIGDDKRSVELGGQVRVIKIEKNDGVNVDGCGIKDLDGCHRLLPRWALRKWNERWVILDPTTGKMEYKMRRNEPNIKGTILFDANSTIAFKISGCGYALFFILSEDEILIDIFSCTCFSGLPKYDGCCICILVCLFIYIGTPQKKDYFLCAETPGAAKAWVSTLHATQLVLRAHKDAVNSLSGSGSSQLGTVATVVAAANSTALEATKEIEAAMKISLRNALGSVLNKSPDGQIDNTTIMKNSENVITDEFHINRQQIGAKQVFEKTESCSDIDTTCPLTKHVDSSDENVDKSCLSVSNEASVTEDGVAHVSGLDQSGVHPAVDCQWNDIQATESRIADVREVAPEGEGSSVDIPVVSSAVSNSQHEQ
ncbi:hypothetical protein Cgig2_004246 [Carnegiea gigantea]|uniref:PH domain-containing protein n=1 Tax=Carnegiea gigantea TaxID=171969 RepID=A0A9Q1GIK2_9CARY|nr:hypothetical protein Cgig2_004246 [Carnegiea gigantea]